MKKIGDLTAQKSNVKTLCEETPWADEINLPHNLRGNVFVKHIGGSLFFGSTSDFQQLAEQIPDTAYIVIIRMDKVQYMDQSGLYAMEDVLTNLVKKDKKVLLVGMVEQPQYLLELIDIIPDLIAIEQIFETFDESVEWVKDYMRNEFARHGQAKPA